MGVPISTKSAARARPVLRRAFAATASILLLAGITTLVPVASAGAASLDTSDPAAVAAAYTSQYLPSTTDSIGWTGSTSGCNAGTTSSQSPAVTLGAINYVRSLAGLGTVSFDPALSARAQQAALMMSANSALSHDPPSSWKCYTQTGADAAGASNLALGAGGGKAVGLYMSDPGTGNAEVGHRRWVLYPQATTFGTGSTSN
ncbi:MAG TPA: CAP domain-containing protein, partial [Galbitalea sp.]